MSNATSLERYVACLGDRYGTGPGQVIDERKPCGGLCRQWRPDFLWTRSRRKGGGNGYVRPTKTAPHLNSTNFRRRALSQAATELASITDATGTEREYYHAHRASSQPRAPKMMYTTRCTSTNRFGSGSWASSVRRGRLGRADPLRPVASHVDLLCDCQGVIDLDSEVPHGTFDFGMAQ